MLEPVKGLHDTCVLLLDFNSLYPSIIQEYNICFTTVQRRSGEEGLPPLPDASGELAVLPTVRVAHASQALHRFHQICCLQTPDEGQAGPPHPQHTCSLSFLSESQAAVHSCCLTILTEVCLALQAHDTGLPTPAMSASAQASWSVQVIAGLVAKRREARRLMAGERDATRAAQLNIRQQALKLTANSMYGCLGFANSRFLARPLAELVTAQGRHILQATVDLVQGSLGAQVCCWLG